MNKNQDNTVSQVITLGCRLNLFESSVIKKNLEHVAPEGVIVVNTCAVTNEAERQAKQKIRKIRREKPLAQLIVTGCSAQLNPKTFLAMPEVDLVLGNEEKMSAEFLKKEKGAFVGDFARAPESLHQDSIPYGGVRSFLQIQHGCDHACTFCAITHARGPNRSVPVDILVAQLQNLVLQGAVEVTLTGVDLTAYGEDFKEKVTLTQLIKILLNQVPDLKRLRLSSLDPAEIDADFFQLLSAEKRLLPHLHLSLQAGSDLILKRMKRRHLSKHVRLFVEKARQARSGIAFGADIITGFPTETEEQFQETCQLVQDLSIPLLHVFPYSEREGTPAARMPQVPVVVRKERSDRLRRLGKKELYSFVHDNLGKSHNVLVEKEGFGYTQNYLPVLLQGSIGKKEGDIVRVSPKSIVQKGERFCLEVSDAQVLGQSVA